MNHLQDIIDRSNAFLLDASGVIYCDYVPILGVQKTIRTMQKKGPVYLVTNNSYQDPITISKQLSTLDICIEPNAIISSGHGLEHDKEIKSLITNKQIFVFGSRTSHDYVYKAGCKNIVAIPEESNFIVLTSSYKDHTNDLLKPLTKFLLKNPQIPIICCNPDKTVMTQNGLKPVIGFFAKQLEDELGASLNWIGKPYANFSNVVKKYLEKDKLSLSKSTCFFDDNIENVKSLQTDLGISGCLVKETGISKYIPISNFMFQTDFIIPSLSE